MRFALRHAFGYNGGEDKEHLDRWRPFGQSQHFKLPRATRRLDTSAVSQDRERPPGNRCASTNVFGMSGAAPLQSKIELLMSQATRARHSHGASLTRAAGIKHV